MSAVIFIKPHHFVDIITSFGEGRTAFVPHPYGHAVHLVAEAILADPRVLLRIELGADDICVPCKHNINGACDDAIDTSFRPTAPRAKREWNLLIDRRWCERLEIAQGDTLSALDLCRRIRDSGGDLSDVYLEIPADMTTDREAKLRRGISTFLKE